MSLSNVEYSSLKKKRGGHNWGGASPKEIFEAELQAIHVPAKGGETGMLHRFSRGETYALQDFEE